VTSGVIPDTFAICYAVLEIALRSLSASLSNCYPGSDAGYCRVAELELFDVIAGLLIVA